MSTPDEPRPDAAEPAPDVPADTPVAPDDPEVEIRDLVDPGSVRRAPRYKGFMVAGVVLGVVIGLAVGLFLLATFDPRRDQPMDKPGVWLTVTVLAATTITTLLAGLLATFLDRRSLKRWNASQAARHDV